MQKVTDKKKLSMLGVLALVAVMLVMQLSSAIIALAENNKTALSVKDIGDAKLYAYLAYKVSPQGNNGGILYKEDAQQLTDLGLYDYYDSNGNVVEGEAVALIDSFDNLAKYCPNIRYIYGGSSVKESARKSLYAEIGKLEKLETVELYVVDESQNEDLSFIFNKAGKENLKTLRLYNHDYSNGAYDFSGLKNLSELTSLDLEVRSNKITGLTESLSGLQKLRYININTVKDMTNIQQEIVDSLPESVYSAEFRIMDNYNNDDEKALDVSKAQMLERITVNGYNKVTGLGKLNNLSELTINSSYYSSSAKTDIDISALNNNITNINLCGCNLGENVDLTGKYTSLEKLFVMNSGITEIKGLNDKKHLRVLNVYGNNLTEVPDISDNSEIRYVDISRNQIAEIPKYFDKLDELEMLDVSRNKIKDISVLENIGDRYWQRIDVSYNELESIPDFSEKNYLDGSWSTSNQFIYNVYKLNLAGNKLTESALEGKLPKGDSEDKFYKYAATTRSFKNNNHYNSNDYQLYFENINDEIISKLLENETGINIYTSQKSFTIGKDLVSKLKNDKGYLYIYNVCDEKAADYVYIDGSSLDDNTTEIPVDFADSTISYSNEEIQKRFSYGDIVLFKQTVDNTDKINGVHYNISDARNYLDYDKTYNEYIYDSEKKTFSYNATIDKSSKYGAHNNAAIGDYYFYVEEAKDRFVSANIIKQTDDNGNIYTNFRYYYNVINDDVILGWKDGTSRYSINTVADRITLSEDAVKKLKNQDNFSYISIYKYNPKENKNTANISIHVNQLKEEAINAQLPEISASNDVNDLSVNFSGGTPENIYKVVKAPDSVSGISYYFINEYGTNTYKVYNNSYVPINIYNKHHGQSISLNNAKDGDEYFAISYDKDGYIEVKNIDDNIYAYMTNPDKTINDIIKYSVSVDSYSNYSYRNLLIKNNSFKINADTITAIKGTTNDVDFNYNFAFADNSTGEEDSKVSIIASRIKNYNVSDENDIEVVKPDVEITTANEDFEKALPAGTPAIYIVNKSPQLNYVTYYYSNMSVINSKLESGCNYLRFRLSNGKTQRIGDLHAGSIINIYNTPVAIVKEADYSTPSDVVKPSTPSDIEKPSEPETKPSEPETKPSEPETKPTQPETKPSEPETKPAESETKPSQPETTPGAIIIPKSENKEGQNNVAVEIAEDALTDVQEVNNELESKMESTDIVQVEVVSKNEAPKLDANIFKTVKEKQKNITVGVTDENNRLQYAWTFNSDTVTNTDMNIDLSISFDTDRADAVKEITGREDVVYLSFAHHGQLPGPATIKTYVGNQYKDGEVIYLYYFNEEKNQVETVGGRPLKVSGGYVEYTITHCSLYFLSQFNATEMNAVDPDANQQVEETGNKDSAQTGDIARVWIYAFETMAVISAIGAAYALSKKREND